MTERRKGPTPGVRLKEMSIKGELTVLSIVILITMLSLVSSQGNFK